MPPIHVEVLACGAPDRGDDGAAVIAVGPAGRRAADDVRIRIVGQLDIDDLLAVPTGAGAIVVDTAVGVDPGWIVEIPFSGLAGRESGIRPRSSHALSIPETDRRRIDHPRPPAARASSSPSAASTSASGEAISWPVARHGRLRAGDRRRDRPRPDTRRSAPSGN